MFNTRKDYPCKSGTQLCFAKVLRSHWAYVRETFSEERQYHSLEKENLAIKEVLRNIELISPYLPATHKSEFKILEVGMGTGKFAVVLKALGYDVYGLDDNGGDGRLISCEESSRC